jgi:hypothetical protein
MHLYTIDSRERKIVPFYIAGASILVGWLFNQLIIKVGIIPAWWIQGPSVLGFYGLFYAGFNKWLWRLLRRIRLIETPNLQGVWKGYITSSFDEHATQHNATIKIFQTWSQINVCLRTDSSESCSLTGSITTKGPGNLNKKC